MDSRLHQQALDALASGQHGDPFALLGAHRAGAGRVVRTLQPQASAVSLLDRRGRVLQRASRRPSIECRRRVQGQGSRRRGT